MECGLDDLVQIVVWYVREEIFQGVSRLSVDHYLGDAWVVGPSTVANAVNGHNFACCCEMQPLFHTYSSDNCTGEMNSNAMYMLGQIVSVHVWSRLEAEKACEYGRVQIEGKYEQITSIP